MIALPPSFTGAVKVTVAWALPLTTLIPVAASGAVTTGVTLLDAVEAAPVPIALVAVTVNVYAVPLVSPVTVIGLAAPVAVIEPGLEVTV